MSRRKFIPVKDNAVETLEHYVTPSDSPPVCATVTEWLHKGFENYQNATALRFGSESLRYNQLNKLANKVANYLIGKGIKQGDRVGISLERSIEMIAVVVGILKAGAAYVPLDPTYPIERLKMMREDAGLKLTVTHAIFSDRFETDSENIIEWKSMEAELNSYSDSDPPVLVEAEDVAYVIFTSGSTGRPKGIAMPHRALSNLIEWQLQRSYFKNKARVLQYSSISFDVSFQEIATTLASGGTLFLIDDTDRRDPRILLQKLDEYNIERLFIPFVALRSLIEVANTTRSLPHSIKEFITAGEQLRVDDAVRSFFYQLPNAILDNQYGPSETHVISAYLLGEDPSAWPDLPPIGKPVKNTSIYLLDDDMQPVEDGEPGELYLAGRNLAHGYIDRDDLTQKSFIQNPIDIPDRSVLYKTGDLGVLNKDNDIEFLGRSDHQIKIRGFRVEPGEINNVGAKFPGIAQCFTHATHNTGAKPQLVTYVVPKEGKQLDEKDFRAHLSKSLPSYMVPAFIMEIESIPYTPSGKVDFKSLPEPKRKISGSEGQRNIKYTSETEAKLAGIWENILGIKNIQPSSNFFDLGGDSLLAVTLLLEIENQFGKAFPLSTLAQAPTLEELTHFIDGKYEGADFRKFRSLRVLQKGDKSNIPLFLVHGGAGNVLIFRKLPEALGPDQPVLAFQWPGWDGRRAENNIIELAKFYKNELRKAWPSGPYRLGGHCIGGVIALEVARLLKEDGAEVIDPILVSDAPNLHSKKYHIEEPESSEEMFSTFKNRRDELEEAVPEDMKESFSGKKRVKKNNPGTKEVNLSIQIKNMLKNLPFYTAARSAILWFHKWAKTCFKNMQQAIRPLRIYGRLAFSKPIAMEDREYYSATNLVRAIKKHKKREYNVDILYLRSALVHGRYLGLKGWWDDVFMGFEEVCLGRFEAHIIGGGHNDIFTNAHALNIIKDKMLTEQKNNPI